MKIPSQFSLRQDSTKKAIAGFAVAAILFLFPPTNPLTPAQIQALADQFRLLADQVGGMIAIGCAFVAALSKILATYHSIIAAINLFHDERKAAIVPAQPPKGYPP